MPFYVYITVILQIIWYCVKGYLFIISRIWTAVYAASYIYYDGGLKSATVDVENRLSNSSVYKNSVSAWNSTNTPVSYTHLDVYKRQE